MSDLISRQAAIDALGEEPEVWSGKDEYEQGLNNQWHYDVNALKALPSAQPKNDYKKALNCIITAYLNPEIRHDILEKFVFETFSVGEVKSEPYKEAEE